MKCLLIEGRGSLVCHHHLRMTPELLHTQMAHGSKRTPVWGQERGIKIGDILQEACASSFLLRRQSGEGLEGSLWFSAQYCTPPTSIIQCIFRTQGIGVLISWMFSWNCHFTCLLRLTQWKQLENVEQSSTIVLPGCSQETVAHRDFQTCSKVRPPTPEPTGLFVTLLYNQYLQVF